MNQTYKRGDIYYGDYGKGIGSEQKGYWPVVIIQNNIGNKYSSTVIVAAVESELEQLFEAVKGDPLELSVIAAAFYGLRRSEVIGLKWDAIDFENKTVSIRHTVTQACVDGKSTVVQKDRTKTNSNYRTLPLVPPFERLLIQGFQDCFGQRNPEYFPCGVKMSPQINPEMEGHSDKNAAKTKNSRKIVAEIIKKEPANMRKSHNCEFKSWCR